MSWRRMYIAIRARTFARKIVSGIMTAFTWLAIKILKGPIDAYTPPGREVPITVTEMGIICREVPITVTLESLFSQEVGGV